MDKQRSSKVIFCIALAVSVFFCIPSYSFADEIPSGEVEVLASESNYDFSLLSGLDDDDYIGSALFQVLSQKTYTPFVYNDVNNSTNLHNFVTSMILPVYLTIGFEVQRGHTYSGAVQLICHTQVETKSYANLISFVFRGYSVESPDGVDVSIYPMFIDSSTGYAKYTVNLNFNNWQSTYDGFVYTNLMLEFDMNETILGMEFSGAVPVPLSSVSTHATDWAGTFKDYATDAIIDSEGSLIMNQTIQQQQIADEQAAISESIAAAQSQQSAEQHQDIVSGYDSAANNDMLTEKNEVLQDFENQQQSAISTGQQYVADFSANYDVTALSAMTPAFSLISMLFNNLWSGMGQFSTVLIVGLMLCVAGYILKLKH